MRHTKIFLHILLFFVIFSLISTQFFKVAFNSENNNTSEINIQDEDCPEDPPERPGNQECDNENREIITSLERPSRRPKATRARPIGGIPPKEEEEEIGEPRPPTNKNGDTYYHLPGELLFGYWDPIRKKIIVVPHVPPPPPIRNVPDPSPGDW